MSFLLTTNRKSLVGFQNMRSDFKFGAPSGEIGMTSLPGIEKRSVATSDWLIFNWSLMVSSNFHLLIMFR